jgi:hypothetical protein
VWWSDRPHEGYGRRGVAGESLNPREVLSGMANSILGAHHVIAIAAEIAGALPGIALEESLEQLGSPELKKEDCKWPPIRRQH